MKKKLTLLIITYFLTQNLFSDPNLIIGSVSNFSNFKLNNSIIVSGERNKNYVQLQQQEYDPTPDTDFLIHFNDANFIDEVGNYTVKTHYKNISDVEKKLGNSSAYFIKDREISFSSNGDSIFSPGRILGDFSIEFWLYPTTVSEDTVIFSWKGVNKVDSEFIPQKIKCYFQERQIVWEFENLFIPVDFAKYSISLKGRNRIIPNSWNHYLIRYNSQLGMLEFLINGIPEDIKYTTFNRNEDMNIYTPYIGNFSKSSFKIGERYRGFMDEFRISESFIENPQLSKFKEKGSFITPVYDLSGDNVNLKSINYNKLTSNETDITYYYRISETPFIQENSSIEWMPIESIQNDIGRYIQIKGNMYSNGDKSLSPLLENITISWLDIPTPPPPQFVFSKPGKNSLNISWSEVKHYDIDGYYLYIGNEKNNYTEVIDVGKNTSYNIENLIYKKIYYFSVRSYSKYKKSE